MPSSNKEGKGTIITWISECHDSIKRVLDLGAGIGTYSKLLRGKHRYLTHSHWTAIEVWEPYIRKYNLRSMYHEVYNEDIRTFDYKKLKWVDLTFAGDVLEHITKEEAIDVINKVMGISRIAIISIPIIHMPQGEAEGNPYEVHVKDDWTHEEVLDTFPHIQKFDAGRKVGVYWLEK